MRNLFIGVAVFLLIAAAGGYYWLEIRGPWERRFCEAIIGFNVQVPGSYRRIASNRSGNEWRIQFRALDPRGMPAGGCAACLFRATEWREYEMRPIMTQFMIDGGPVDTSRFEEPARSMAGDW